jgi:tripartite-type tricarboxylate transporter receptor subunit TctC
VDEESQNQNKPFVDIQQKDKLNTFKEDKMQKKTLSALSQQPTKRALAVTLSMLIMGAVLCSNVLAQTWPTKPVKVIVNFPPGGAADQIARAIGIPLAEALGQPVVVENRGGANGNLGGDAVAKSAADGYTLLMSSGGMVSVNPHIYARMSFDPAKDLIPVASAARVLVYLVTKSNFPADNIQEFLKYAKENPGRLSYGSAGNGSSLHLAGEMMKSQAGLFAVHVPYRGAAPALQDVLAGQLDFYFDPGIGLGQVRAGKLKLMAVGSLKRSPVFPNVPTLEEAGLKGFDADSVFGFYAPAGTPAEVVTKLNREINRILATPALKDRIQNLGGEALPLSPAEFGTRASDDSKRFGAIIRERKITGD